jgi:UTP--glucose-1-phosphate uridylyltransferase
MIELFESKRASCVVAVEEVPDHEVSQYGIIHPSDSEGDTFRVQNLIEKPSLAEAPSRLAVAARYVFAPIIFDMLRQVKPDLRGEIQLTNAMKMLCEEGRRVFAVRLGPDEKRYDIGNFPSYYETFVEFALADPEHGAGFRKWLSELLRSQ